ncbi:MAG TPA: hypothetical protein VH796_04460 [Nitrososphaeraceae archaeon]
MFESSKPIGRNNHCGAVFYFCVHSSVGHSITDSFRIYEWKKGRCG